MMLICSFILFEQLDSAGSYSTLFRSIDIGVEKANAILHVPPMDIDGQDIPRSAVTLLWSMWIFPMIKRRFWTMSL